MTRLAGGTSTGSKRPEALYGAAAPSDLPIRMIRSYDAQVVAEDGRTYLDFIAALGAVSLGYAHPAVVAAAQDAVARGTVGSLAPRDEEALAARLVETIPWLEQVRFLKTGAEAVAAAVRLARAATGRDLVLGAGYHGWLDLTSDAPGVPAAVQRGFRRLPFNDSEAARHLIRKSGNALAAVVIEPVVDGAPSVEWLRVLRDETAQVGAVLIYDEIKTGFRVALGGAAERWGVVPDLAVYGKALGNGFPIAAVGGVGRVMDQVGRTWISSTLATEYVSLAAARAAVDESVRVGLPAILGRLGQRLYDGLAAIATRHPGLVAGVRGIPEMCYLAWHDPAVGAEVAIEAARRGLLFKRTAYNFVTLAHAEADIDRCLTVVAAILDERAS
ncbi:MAG: aminotransferase class III-fold pyridoxal phosphate-dependent enzyme [Gemmatimonadales bacterium]|nr:aminotransferase class III-fold pyridoxal phosphate-dependent enzyme [Gemmatimonadales bacterium]